MLNYIFAFLVFVSFVYYFYFKTRQFRTSHMHPIRKKMYASMAGYSLGALLIFFGLNQIILFDKVVNYIVAAIFIALGLYVLVTNYRGYAHYKKFVAEEAEINPIN